MMARCNDSCVGISAAIFTLVQTAVHAWWVKFGRKLYVCGFNIRQRTELYMYLTYFYTDDCAKIHKKQYQITRNLTRSNGENMYEVLLPLYDDKSNFMESMMFLAFIVDAVWFVASVSLLIGNLVKIKQCSAVISFTPWMLATVVSLMIDLLGSIYFGVKLSKIKIKLEPETLTYFAIMIMSSGRLGVFWIINVVLLIMVAKVTINAYNDPEDGDPPENVNNNDNTTEARIKNWQLFYGPIEEESPRSRMSYSNTFRDLELNKKPNLCSTVISSTPPPMKLSVNTSQQEVRRASQVNTELRGQLPWSYTQNQLDLKIKSKEDENRVILLLPDGGIEEKMSKL